MDTDTYYQRIYKKLEKDGDFEFSSHSIAWHSGPDSYYRPGGSHYVPLLWYRYHSKIYIYMLDGLKYYDGSSKYHIAHTMIQKQIETSFQEQKVKAEFKFVLPREIDTHGQTAGKEYCAFSGRFTKIRLTRHIVKLIKEHTRANLGSPLPKRDILPLVKVAIKEFRSYIFVNNADYWMRRFLEGINNTDTINDYNYNDPKKYGYDIDTDDETAKLVLDLPADVIDDLRTMWNELIKSGNYVRSSVTYPALGEMPEKWDRDAGRTKFQQFVNHPFHGADWSKNKIMWIILHQFWLTQSLNEMRINKIISEESYMNWVDAWRTYINAKNPNTYNKKPLDDTGYGGCSTLGCHAAEDVDNPGFCSKCGKEWREPLFKVDCGYQSYATPAANAKAARAKAPEFPQTKGVVTGGGRSTGKQFWDCADEYDNAQFRLDGRGLPQHRPPSRLGGLRRRLGQNHHPAFVKLVDEIDAAEARAERR